MKTFCTFSKWLLLKFVIYFIVGFTTKYKKQSLFFNSEYDDIYIFVLGQRTTQLLIERFLKYFFFRQLPIRYYFLLTVIA